MKIFGELCCDDCRDEVKEHYAVHLVRVNGKIVGVTCRKDEDLCVDCARDRALDRENPEPTEQEIRESLHDCHRVRGSVWTDLNKGWLEREEREKIPHELIWFDECRSIDPDIWKSDILDSCRYMKTPPTPTPKPIEPLGPEEDSNHYVLDDLLHGHNKICLETQNGVEIDIFVSSGVTYISIEKGETREFVTLGNICFIEPDEVE
jgi:hypothetical protein